MGGRRRLGKHFITDNIRAIQRQKKMTTREFAKFLGMAYSSVCQLIDGTNIPTVATLIKIAERCGVSLDWLCSQNDSEVGDA